MTLKRTLFLGAILLVAGITLLQLFINQGARFGGMNRQQGSEKFRVGFLPVT
jgi:hypothetical protein